MPLLTFVSSLFATCSQAQERPKNAAPAASAMSFYDFELTSLDGKPVSLATFKGKKVLLVNTASKCGYTPQYAALEKLYEQYKDKNVVVLGFPANNFMAQEPGKNEDIKTFCTKNYGVTFPMFEKIDVVGKHQHPLYKWLSTKALNGWNADEPSWNFCKYLVNEKGELVAFFPSKIDPLDAKITDKLK